MLRELARFLLEALRCPCFWYCLRVRRLDCAACRGWSAEAEAERREAAEDDARLARLEAEMLAAWLN